MCIRDRLHLEVVVARAERAHFVALALARMRRDAAGLRVACLLYTSDAADERSSVDLGGRRIIKKKTNDT